MAKLEGLAKAFADAIASHRKNDDLLNLFAKNASWSDPVGAGPPYVGTDALKGRISKMPPMDSVVVKEVFFCMSPKIFLVKMEVTMTGKPPVIVLDSIELDDELKFLNVESHFHPPSAVGGAPRPAWMEQCDDMAQKFGEALLSHGQNEDLINLFAENASWMDPVGGPPPYVGTEALKARIANLPPMDSVKVCEVFYSMSPQIFLVKTEVKFTGKDPFFILDKFMTN